MGFTTSLLNLVYWVGFGLVMTFQTPFVKCEFHCFLDFLTFGVGDHFQVLQVSEGTCTGQILSGWGTTFRSSKCQKGHVPSPVYD